MAEYETLAQWIRRHGPFAAGDPVPRRVVPLMAADYNQLRDELNEPRLGLATTRQLLEELAVRLELGGTSQIERSSAATLRGMLGVLPVDCLAYRTVDGQPDCGDPDCYHAPDGGNHPVTGNG